MIAGLLIGAAAFLLPLLLPIEVRESLAFHRAEGSWWTFATFHWVHVGFWHAASGLGTWALTFFLLRRAVSLRAWVVVTLASATTTALGLEFASETAIHFGASGMLHGILVGAAVVAWPRQRGLSLALLALVTLKLLAESAWGPSAWSENTIGVRIAVEAHVFGALGGALSGALLLAKHRFSRIVGGRSGQEEDQ